VRINSFESGALRTLRRFSANALSLFITIIYKAGDFYMEVILSSTLGTIFYTVVVFVAGALIGTPLWNWVSEKLPWNK